MKPKPEAPATPRIPPKWAWHYQRLQELRDRLLKDRGEELAESAEPIEPHSMDIADSASDEFDHDLALSILSREEEALLELDAAIHRILHGTYGICEETGKAIPPNRLRAVPWIRYTRDAKEWLEEHGVGAEPAHLGPVSSLQGTAAFSEAEEPANEELQGQEIARHQRERAIQAIKSGEESEVSSKRSRPREHSPRNQRQRSPSKAHLNLKRSNEP